ncbi:uncharacterized protein LOC130561270 [Triplophysa rosa]|uniref:uncharacterized protein LOC130561270 n=1 Tax=Triplophysa rosa TaxID=992332 RepID=UPI002545C906|nr:uncharacterized protein LOC130561270 [Triplophysa rosa]
MRKRLWRTWSIAAIALCCRKSSCGVDSKLPLPSVSSSAFLTRMGDTVTATRLRGPPGARRRFIGLTCLILRSPKRISSRATSRSPMNRLVPAMKTTRAFLGSQRTRRPSHSLVFTRLTPAALPQSILLDVCERAAARLNIPWPAPQSATDQERDVYDGKVLGPPPGPRKQLFPVLPACAKHVRHYWSDPLNLKHGLAGLEVKDMPSIARHLNPVQGGLLAPPKPVLPGKMDRFSASVHQAAYKSSALAVRALNVSSLLSAYQAEILEDLGQQLDKGSPSPTLWKEILTVNDLVLRNARQAVQACGRSMALSVVGERALWLNLSGLPDSEKRRVAGAPVEPGQALFGPAVALMQQRCDDKKKEDEAFKLCLPKKAAPRQLPTARLPNPPRHGAKPAS